MIRNKVSAVFALSISVNTMWISLKTDIHGIWYYYNLLQYFKYSAEKEGALASESVIKLIIK